MKTKTQIKARLYELYVERLEAQDYESEMEALLCSQELEWVIGITQEEKDALKSKARKQVRGKR